MSLFFPSMVTVGWSHNLKHAGQVLYYWAIYSALQNLNYNLVESNSKYVLDWSLPNMLDGVVWVLWWVWVYMEYGSSRD